MQIENNNSRSNFLKKIALGIVSVVGFGIAGFNLQKNHASIKDNTKTISEEEANNLIKSMHSPKPNQLKPEPPPNNSTQ